MLRELWFIDICMYVHSNRHCTYVTTCTCLKYSISCRLIAMLYNVDIVFL